MIAGRRGTKSQSTAFVRVPPTWVLFLILGLFAFPESSIGPAMRFIRARLDLSYTTASLHFSAFALGGVITGFAGDRVVRRTSRRSALWLGMTGMTFWVASLAVSPVVAGTILGAFVTGAAGTALLIGALVATRYAVRSVDPVPTPTICWRFHRPRHTSQPRQVRRQDDRVGECLGPGQKSRAQAECGRGENVTVDDLGSLGDEKSVQGR